MRNSRLIFDDPDGSSWEISYESEFMPSVGDTIHLSFTDSHGDSFNGEVEVTSVGRFASMMLGSMDKDGFDDSLIETTVFINTKPC